MGEKKHRVLVVGVGSIGERHVRCFQHSNRADVAICEPNDRLREEVASRYGVANQFSDLESALQQSHDAAVIAVPANLHVSLAQKCVDAGLHVLIEKPLAVSTAGVDRLQRSAASQNLVAAVAYVYRAHPALAAMRARIHSGAFGQPLQVVVVAGQNFPMYRPGYRSTYYARLEQGGGAVQDAITHLINAAEWLVGPMERVVSDIDHKAIEGVDVEDVVNLLARHGNVIASYTLNQFQAPNEASITVVCEGGTARFEYHQQRWSWMTRPDTPWQEERATGPERDSLFIRQAESFLDAVEFGAAPLCSLEEGLQTLRCNLAILASANTRSWCLVNDDASVLEPQVV